MNWLTTNDIHTFIKIEFIIDDEAEPFAKYFYGFFIIRSFLMGIPSFCGKFVTCRPNDEWHKNIKRYLSYRIDRFAQLLRPIKNLLATTNS